MNDLERNVIRSNRTSLVQHIINVETVLDGLLEEGLFTETMNEDILVQKTKTAQVRMLLDYVVRRGPNAFDRFYDVLVRSGDGQAADFLKPDLKSQRMLEWEQRMRQPSSIGSQNHSVPYIPSAPPLPTKWPDDSLPKPKEIPLTWCSPHAAQLSNSPDVFPLTSGCRGHAVIIDNENFEKARDNQVKLDDRQGTKEDEAAIGETFHKLGFKVILHRDLTAEEMEIVLTQEALSDHSKSDCLVVFVLSHGEKDSVFGVDGKTVHLSYFLDRFDGDKAPTLVDKPKLFFIQACQGRKEDVGSVPSQPTEDMIQALKNLHLNKADQNMADANCERTRPSKAEAFMALATTADYVSWRNIKTGTWFIQALVFVLRKYAATDHLSELMTKVTRLVSQAETASGLKQVSEHRSTLTRNLYFFPGVPEPINTPWNPEESLLQTAVASPSEEQAGPPPFLHSISNSSIASSASSASLNQVDRRAEEMSSLDELQEIHDTLPKTVDQAMEVDSVHGPVQCTDHDPKPTYAF